MFKFVWIGLLFFYFGCSAIEPQTVPDEKAFGISDSLKNQFSVVDNDNKKIASVEPEPVIEKTTKKTKKSQVTKKKKSKQKEPVKEEPKFSWPNRWKIDPFFREGERYVFDITYFGATAGELELILLPEKKIADRKVYHIRAIARTTSVFSLFYRMNDVAESYLDSETLVSHKFSLKLDESLQQRDVLELYDQVNNKVHYYSKLDHKKKGKKDEQKVLESIPYTQDGLSAFYFVRTLPYEVGKTYEFPVMTNGKMRDVRVTVVGKEDLPTKIGKIPAIIIKPEVVLDGILKTYGDSFVWLSDDFERRILKVDAKIKVGSVIAYLKEHSYGAGSKALEKK
ncbi:MAG: DUF3108 domain-containing protein [Oligoflexia bacterium]|nr:DUF3108 domain-containing protein [Oligoflexia bacterium]